MDIKQIVDKLLGSCNPQGCATRDKEALISLTERIKLIEELIIDIQYIARKDKDSYESSVRAIGERADRFLRELKEEL